MTDKYGNETGYLLAFNGVLTGLPQHPGTAYPDRHAAARAASGMVERGKKIELVDNDTGEIITEWKACPRCEGKPRLITVDRERCWRCATGTA